MVGIPRFRAMQAPAREMQDAVLLHLHASEPKVHCCAVRLCALVYFFAFLGQLGRSGVGQQCAPSRAVMPGSLRNVVDGPIMWKLEPPSGYTAQALVRWNQIALLPTVLVLLRRSNDLFDGRAIINPLVGCCAV